MAYTTQVRRTALERVKLWHFSAEPPLPGTNPTVGFVPLSSLPSPMFDAPCAPAAWCIHARFPTRFFPEFPTWSRKGYLLTRWSLGASAVDLINMHNFHDDSNLIALRRESSARRSVYADRRATALTHVVDVATTEPSWTAAAWSVDGRGDGAAPLTHQRRPATFLFGDFNFRLDLAAVTAHLCGASGLATAQSHDSAIGPLALPLLASAAAASAPDEGRDPVQPQLDIAPKLFQPSSAASHALELSVFLSRDSPMRSFDREVTEYCRAHVPAAIRAHRLKAVPPSTPHPMLAAGFARLARAERV